MSHSCESRNLPEDFSFNIAAFGKDYKLETFQTFPVSRRRAFAFFQNPQNLSYITPDWLDFRMDAYEAGKIFRGAEYDYHIRWLGLRVRWRSRIQAYNPPYDFTDVQIRGPYKRWEHSHSFEEAGGTTLMSDTVIYRLPFSLLGTIVHGLLVKKQLEDIFCYRALKIMEWVKEAKHEDLIYENDCRNIRY